MFKTMWKMPAKLVRCAVASTADDGDGDDQQIASGSLEEMIKAADALGTHDDGADDGQTLIIRCVGRDRPITWAEITGLRNAAVFATDS